MTSRVAVPSAGARFDRAGRASWHWIIGCAIAAVVIAMSIPMPAHPGVFLSLSLGEEHGMLDTDEPPANLFNPRIEGYRLR